MALISVNLSLYFEFERDIIMSRPNLFKFATSELSQDAFICWLLSWASPENKEEDAKLHICALEFINALFAKYPQKTHPSTIEKVVIKKQDANIDVLCIINDQFVILIEDKTNTANHSNQLANYLSEIEGRSYDKDCIFPIYFKTYDQASYKDVVEKNKYQVFSRNDFLSVLNKGQNAGIENAIFQDFREHLQRIQNNVESYLRLPISPKSANPKWNSQAWTGFYLHLQKELGTGLWRKVNNEAGGFMGFWWGNQSGKPYLLLEENKLCFKIKVDDPAERKKLRTYWYKLIKSKQVDAGFTLTKPVRFGSGKNMTIMVAEEDYRQVTEDGCIDMLVTVNRLKQIQAFLHEIQNHTT